MNVKTTAALAAALVAAGKLFDLGEAACTQALVWAGYDLGRAAARAPALWGCLIGLAGIAALSGYIRAEEERSRRRRRYIRREHARNTTPAYRAGHEKED